jgi:uncharacterized membrane protein
MIDYLIVFLLGGFPILEVRGAVLYGIGMGLNPYLVLLLGIIGNILIIPVVFYFFKKSHFRSLAMRFFGHGMQEKIERHRARFEKWDELALLSFVALPLPVTGAYTGAFLAEVLNLNRKKSFFVISLGVVIAALIVFGGVTGIVWLL